ncbi:MAG: hypothetical protein V4616_09845 [Bacteroidota bacterium]
MIRTLSSTLVTCGFLIIAYFTLISFRPELEHKQFYAFLVFFAGLQLLSGFAFSRFQTEQDAEKFVMTFLVSTGAKFILSLFIILILVKTFPEQKRLLAFSFCIQYLLFLTVDSVALLTKIGRRN